MRRIILLMIMLVILASSCYKGAPGTPSLFMVGDSIMEDSLPTLEPHLQQFNRTAAWGARGWTTEDTELVTSYMGREYPMERVVINLGSNDVVQYSISRATAAMQRLLDDMPSATCVVWVGVRETGVTPFYHGNWQNKATAINNWLQTHPRVTYLDWERIARNRPEFFQGDGLHLSGYGQRVYNGQVARTVANNCA